MKIFWIDLFAGAGGTTTGIHMSGLDNVEVVACVNHDKNAILSHEANHPDCKHFIEDVRDFKVVKKLSKLVDRLRIEYPDCIINIWASLECTNYSKAKGGLPRDADSRTLAYAMYNYIDELNPDYLYIENVVEFMAWGPLDENGRPISRLNGQDYIRWSNAIQNYGYRYDYSVLNSADFGAYQSRKRFFGVFAKDNLPITWPAATHTKKVQDLGLFNNLLKPWKPVRDVLQLDNEGQSIFNRKKDLVDNTLERIYAGLIKFVANGDDTFIQKYYSGRPMGKVISIEGPAGTVKTIDGQAKVKCVFIGHYYGNGFNSSIDVPCPTIRTKDSAYTIFIDSQYKSGKATSILSPIGTLTTIPKFNIVTTHPYIINKNSSTSPSKSIDEPCPTITQRTHYLLNPQFNSAGASVNKPCFTLIARMDKRPPYIIELVPGQIAIVIYDSDSPVMIKIKKFMAAYGIIDIKMRMLNITELKRIQGLPDDYILIGTKAEQKKFIGNAVHTNVAKAICQANTNSLIKKMEVAS